MYQETKTLDIIRHFSTDSREFVIPTLMKIVKLTEAKYAKREWGSAYWRSKFGNLGWIFSLIDDLCEADRQAVLLMIDRTKQCSLVPKCRKSETIVSFFSNTYCDWSWVRLAPLLKVMQSLRDNEFHRIGFFFDEVNALDQEQRQRLLVLARQLTEN